MATDYQPWFLDVQAASGLGGVVVAELKLWHYPDHGVYWELRRFLFAKADSPHTVVVNRAVKALLGCTCAFARVFGWGSIGLLILFSPRAFACLWC